MGFSAGEEREETPGDWREQADGLDRHHPRRVALGRDRKNQKTLDEQGFKGEGGHADGEHDLSKMTGRPEQRDPGEGQAESGGDQRSAGHHIARPTRYSRSHSSSTMRAHIFPEWS